VPHAPATPTPRHAEAFPGVQAPRTASFNQADLTAEPQWLRNRPLLGDQQQASIDELYRKRLQSMLDVDDLVEHVVDTLQKAGQLDNTYIVFTSDNGFHLGQLGLMRGKGTAYDTDTRVPLLVVGPRVVPGSRDTMVSNIDLAPTFEELAGVATPPYRSGRSLVPTLADPAAPVSDYVFFEHTFSMSRPGDDPDRAFTGGGLNVIPSYVAVRSRTALLVRNDVDRRWGRHRYAYELYDYGEHAWERTNRYADPDHAAVLATLMAKLDEWDACSRGPRLVSLADRGVAARLTACP
jgi:N-acetylglucosamine-6-sulfatase